MSIAVVIPSLKLEVTMLETKGCDFIAKALYKNKHWNQDYFSDLVCGGLNKNYEVINGVFKLDVPKLRCEKYTYNQGDHYDRKTDRID